MHSGNRFPPAHANKSGSAMLIGVSFQVAYSVVAADTVLTPIFQIRRGSREARSADRRE
jgi:hypothetical protein